MTKRRKDEDEETCLECAVKAGKPARLSVRLTAKEAVALDRILSWRFARLARTKVLPTLHGVLGELVTIEARRVAALAKS